jgi:hypothetical protein
MISRNNSLRGIRALTLVGLQEKCIAKRNLLKDIKRWLKGIPYRVFEKIPDALRRGVMVGRPDTLRDIRNLSRVALEKKCIAQRNRLHNLKLWMGSGLPFNLTCSKLSKRVFDAAR